MYQTLTSDRQDTYLDWDCDDSVSSPDLCGAERLLFVRRSAYGPSGVSARFAFLSWLVGELVALRLGCVIVVNKGLALSLCLARWPLGFCLVIDLHYPFSYRGAAKPFGSALNLIQSVVRSCVHVLIVTDENRYSRLEGRHREKATIVTDYPSRQKFDVRKVVSLGKSGKVAIATVGYLHSSRAMRILRQAIDRYGNWWAKVSGCIADDEAASSRGKPSAPHRGVIGLQESPQHVCLRRSHPLL